MSISQKHLNAGDVELIEYTNPIVSGEGAHSEQMDSRRHFSAKIADNCTIIKETGVILHSLDAQSPDATQKNSQLISLKTMDLTSRSKFSVKIVSTGRNASIGIGLVPEDYEPEAFPGWYDESVGYHADDGGIYIESGYLSKRTKKAKDGDIISIEIYTDEKDTKKRLGRFRKNNNPIGAETIDLEGKGLYPCLSMESKGAAVQILEDEFWYLDEDGTDITFMTTEQKEDVWISPAKEIILTERTTMDGQIFCTGLMSIANQTEQEIVFKLQYREDKYYLLGKDHLPGKRHAWAQRLKIERADVGDAIKVEWVLLTGKDSANDKDKESLKKLFNVEGTPQNKTYTLNVKIEKIENTDNQEDHDKKRQTVQFPQRLSTAAKDDDPTDLLKYLRQHLHLDDDVSSSSSDDNDDDVSSTLSDDDEHKKKAPITLTDQGLVNMVSNCLENVSDEIQIIKNVKEMLKEKNEIKVDGSYSREGFTCLHLAAATGFIKLAELLLKKGANLAKKSKNDERIMPLELAIENKKDETGELLVKKMTRDSVVKLFWNENNPEKTKLSIKSLLEAGLMKTTLAVLEKFKHPYGDYFVAPLELDNRMMCACDDKYSITDMTAYQMIARKKLKDFPCHEVVKALTEYKWMKYGRWLFRITALVYFICWISLSVAAVMGVMANDVAKYDKTADYVRGGFEITTCAYAILTLAAESLQIYHHKTEYLKDVFNYIEFMSSALILCIPPLRFTYFYEQWYVFAVGYIMWTFRILKFVALNRRLGHLCHIIVQLVVYDVGKFVVFFTIVLLSFSGGLMLSLKGDDDLAVHNETSTYWGIIFVGIRVLIEGPFLDYTGPSGYSTFSTIIMLLFLAFACVVMLNIFIAQLSNRFEAIQQNASREFDINKAKTIAKLELKDDFTCFFFGQALWKKHHVHVVDEDGYDVEDYM